MPINAHNVTAQNNHVKTSAEIKIGWSRMK